VGKHSGEDRQSGKRGPKSPAASLRKLVALHLHRPPCQPQEGFQDQLWELTEAAAQAIASRTASACFDPLLRKYVEATRPEVMGRLRASDILVSRSGRNTCFAGF
jgi:hypothetical protein